MDYQSQLNDVRWFAKRDEILERDDYCCQDCLRGKDRLSPYIKLHVHHRAYITGRMAWDYPNEFLITLCDECHKMFHQLKSDYRTDRQKPTFVYDYLRFESRPVKHISEVMVEMIETYYAKKIY